MSSPLSSLVHLTLRDFRNVSALDLAVPAPGCVVIGDNGHGKSNLLEAIAYLRLMRSSRGARDQDVVRFGAPAFHVRAALSDGSTVTIGFERATKRKRATRDGVEHARLSDALGALPSVGFSPDDVVLVSGGPGDRRRFLDVTLALTSRPYLEALEKYRRALRHRNAALRTAGGSRDSVAQASAWEPLLVREGAIIIAARLAWVRAHHEAFSRDGAAIGETQPVTMRYSTTTAGDAADDIAASLAVQFDTHRAQEMKRGLTLVGPHRDDLLLLLDGRELRTFGSAGQQRSAALALRLREAATVHAALGAPPLLLLDDPFAELDPSRSAAALQLVASTASGQVVLAVPRASEIPEAFTALPRFTMRHGELTAVSV
jgi:DNA replication and repair protein RecF